MPAQSFEVTCAGVLTCNVVGSQRRSADGSTTPPRQPPGVRVVLVTAHVLDTDGQQSSTHCGIACGHRDSLPDQAAEPDPLRDCAAGLVAHLNAERTEDVLRIGAFALGVPLDALQGAQLLWLDRLGIYLFAATTGGPGAQVLLLLLPLLLLLLTLYWPQDRCMVA